MMRKHFHPFGISIEFVLGIILGLFVDICANYIRNQLQISLYATIIIQIILITFVLYVIHHFQFNIAKIWSEDDAYGIIFTSIFIASQRNIILLLDNIYESIYFTT